MGPLTARAAPPLLTPDGRYLVAHGRLWRRFDPALAPKVRITLVARQIDARRTVGAARRAGNSEVTAQARRAVGAAKVALGERGPVWWSDGAPDLTRRMASTTCYAEWFQ